MQMLSTLHAEIVTHCYSPFTVKTGELTSLPNGSEIFATGVTTFLLVKDHYSQFTTSRGGDLHCLLLVNITI